MAAEAFFTNVFLTLLLALIVSVLVFPLVFVFSFVYQSLEKKYKKTPKIILLYACTLLAAVTAVFLLEIYLGYTLPEIASTLQPGP